MKKLVLLTFLLQLAVPALQAAERPNILFILVDDQSPYDLKAYDPKSPLDSPNIDRLSAEGMTFDGAYQMGSWVGAVCTASRHMIMSGRTVWHIPDKSGRTNNPNVGNSELVPTDLANHTMAAVFNRAGYDTVRTCKNGNSYEDANKQFTIRHDETKRGGTAESGSAWHGEQILDYLGGRAEKKDTKPFLIYYGFSHPHDTRDGTPELLAKYGAVNHTDQKVLPPAHPKQPALQVNYLPGHPFHHGHPGLRDEVSVSGVWEKRDERTIRNELGREYACSENIDIQIGRVLAKLKEMGELDNTYIFYTSDHGIAIGRHGLQGKQNLYEHTWRVPFIVKGPGIAHGSRAKGNIYLLDVLSTICDLTGVAIPKSNEGISFKPVLEGKAETVRDVLYGVYCGGTKPGMRSVKKGDWKLIKYDVMDGAVRETQLFNLAENPNELLAEHQDPATIALTGNTPQTNQRDLAEDPAYAEKLAEMEALLLSEQRRLHDPYRLWNQPDDGLTPPVIQTPAKRKRKTPSRMRGFAFVSGVCLVLCSAPLDAGESDPMLKPYTGPSEKGADTSTLTGKVMCGYQGWFNCEGDGADLKWVHWGKDPQQAPGPGNVSVDLWPDLSEYGPEERFATSFKHVDGRPAEVFSSHNKATVLRHFQWMRDYGIDGAFVQRFANGLNHSKMVHHKNVVLSHAREGANRHGRAYAVMYDLSGLGSGKVDMVRRDWVNLRKQMRITEDPAYLNHEGHPVVAVWGIGFSDDRAYSLAECRSLIEFLKADQCTVMLGVPSWWREGQRDATPDPELQSIIELADIVSPWTVGRYRNPGQARSHAEKVWGLDLAWCQQRQLDFLPVVFPGFSWHNLKGEGLAAIPRMKGQFLWSQLIAAKRTGSEMIYVAMFDEVDEGTAIFKCTNDPPAAEGTPFLSYEGLPSDHYLRLTGLAGKLLREEIPVSETFPTK